MYRQPIIITERVASLERICLFRVRHNITVRRTMGLYAVNISKENSKAISRAQNKRILMAENLIYSSLIESPRGGTSAGS